MLVAAESSGDGLGAGLARALKARLGDEVRIVGVGGPRMAAQGVESPFDISDLSVLGWIEGLKAYGRVRRRVADTVAFAQRAKAGLPVPGPDDARSVEHLMRRVERLRAES